MNTKNHVYKIRWLFNKACAPIACASHLRQFCSQNLGFSRYKQLQGIRNVGLNVQMFAETLAVRNGKKRIWGKWKNGQMTSVNNHPCILYIYLRPTIHAPGQGGGREEFDIHPCLYIWIFCLNFYLKYAPYQQLLRPEVRSQYLTRVHDFMKTDNNRNWRFREELAEYVNLVHSIDCFFCLSISFSLLELIDIKKSL